MKEDKFPVMEIEIEGQIVYVIWEDAFQFVLDGVQEEEA